MLEAAEKLGWRLGCQAYTFHKFTFAEALEKIASVGMKYVEAYPGQALSPDKRDVIFHHDMCDCLAQEALDMVAARGLTLVNYGVVGLPNDEAECRKIFDFAKKMGIETICSEPKRDAMPLIDRLTQEYGIGMAIHNHPSPSEYALPEAVLEACDGLGPKVGACADTGHWMRSGVNPVEALKKLEGSIISFHFKDVDAMKPDATDVPFGTGAADAMGMLREIRRQGVSGVFAMEYEANWDNSLPDIARCVEFFDKAASELL